MKAIKHVSLIDSLEAFLLEKRLITPDQIAVARRFMSENNACFGTAILFLRFIDPGKLAHVLHQTFGIPQIEPQTVVLSQGARKALPPEIAKSLHVFPLSLIDESGQASLLLGMTDPLDRASVAKVEQVTRLKVQRAFLSLDDLQNLYRRYYRAGLSLLANIPDSSVSRAPMEAVTRSTASRARQDAPVASQLSALVALLIRKGLFTEEEFLKELAKAGA